MNFWRFSDKFQNNLPKKLRKFFKKFLGFWNQFAEVLRYFDEILGKLQENFEEI